MDLNLNKLLNTYTRGICFRHMGTYYLGRFDENNTVREFDILNDDFDEEDESFLRHDEIGFVDVTINTDKLTSTFQLMYTIPIPVGFVSLMDWIKENQFPSPVTDDMFRALYDGFVEELANESDI